MAGDNVTSKYFRLQPKYLGRRRIKITVCNVPIQLNEEVLAAFLSTYGDIEEVTKAKSPNRTVHGDYLFTMCLDRGGFMAILHTVDYESQVMTVVVEGRKPQCWNCKQLGHFSKSCPQKTTKTTTTDNNNNDHNDNDNSSSSDFGDHTVNKQKPQNWGPPGQRRRGLDPGNKRGGKKKKTPLKTNSNSTNRGLTYRGRGEEAPKKSITKN